MPIKPPFSGTLDPLARRYCWRYLNLLSDNALPWLPVLQLEPPDGRDAPPRPSVRTPAERRPVSAPPCPLLPRYVTWQGRLYLAFIGALPTSTSLWGVLLLAGAARGAACDGARVQTGRGALFRGRLRCPTGLTSCPCRPANG